MLITLLRQIADRRSSGGDEGTTAVEYALLAGLIAVIVVTSLTLLGGNLHAMFNDLAGGGSARS